MNGVRFTNALNGLQKYDSMAHTMGALFGGLHPISKSGCCQSEVPVGRVVKSQNAFAQKLADDGSCVHQRLLLLLPPSPLQRKAGSEVLRLAGVALIKGIIN